MEKESTDETKESILFSVQHILVCEDASSQEIKSWVKEDNQYEITDDEQGSYSI